jgi:Tfp pilus assembly protein PilF
LKLSPRLVEARNNLATILCQKGEIDRAISELEEAIRIQPDNIDALNNLTWILAMPVGTGSEKRLKALPLAQRLQELVGNNNPKVLRTIAAAYAANGKLTEALNVAEQGAKLAREQADTPSPKRSKPIFRPTGCVLGANSQKDSVNAHKSPLMR